MALDKSGGTIAVRSVQKLQGTIPSQSWPQGSTVKTFAMPSFNVGVPGNAVVENLWWRVVSGTLTQPIDVRADVQAIDQVTVVVTNPGAAMTLSLEVGGTVIEYG